MRALLVFVLAAASLVTGIALSQAGPDLRPILLTATSGRVRSGDEEQLCQRRRLPRGQGTDVNRVSIKVKGGSHHVHLYRPYNGEVAYPPKNCPFSVDFHKWQLVAATQTPLLDWQLPPGVAINFSARQPLMIQTHFVNAQKLDVTGTARAKLKLYPMDPAEVQAHGGALFGQDKTVQVPPGESTEISRCALTGDAAEGRRLTIMALTGHYHFRGVEFSVYRVHADGSLGEQVYLNQGYTDPEFEMYDDGALVLEPGEGLEWWCRYQNDTTETFEFGANTQRNEHCNLFGFYYPTQTPQEAIACIHRIENGQELNERIVAQ